MYIFIFDILHDTRGWLHVAVAVIAACDSADLRRDYDEMCMPRKERGEFRSEKEAGNYKF